ncbi:hypothetical protein [Polyangium aurulentum]|uniref:hypothetical protein n=1 Tax=Polyangium aurulentum TaxID=2567896 RepID=UPI0010AE2B11|nr:hypothetical protein [Polyangium aurulentum]UQA59381.1 hypothetical protein E8A73_002405 [Polyangium aurulentum]
MNITKHHVQRAAALVFLSSLVALGCVGDELDTSSEVPAEQGGETLTMNVGDHVVRGEKVDPTRVHVDIFDRRGGQQFSTDFTLGGAQDETIRWTLFAESSPALTGSLQGNVEQLPTLARAIDATRMIYTNVSNASAGQEYDNWGCDSFLGAGPESCGPNGKCCDVHDACFARHDCTASSWVNPFASRACKRCNAAVTACIATTDPGPSVCCARGNCGQPR